MNWLLKRYYYALGAGCYFMLAQFCAKQALDSRPPVKIPPFDREAFEAAQLEVVNETMAGLAPAAGERHRPVGANKFSCALCLMPETHPIHIVDAIDRDALSRRPPES